MFVHDSFSVSTRSNHQSLFFNKAAVTPFMNTFYYRISLVAASIHSLSHLIRFDHFIYDWTILLWTLWLTILWLFIILLRMTASMICLNFLFLILVVPFLSNFQRSFWFHNQIFPWWIPPPPRKIPAQKIPTHVFKYSQPRFLIFCLLMLPLSLLLVKFDNRSLL